MFLCGYCVNMCCSIFRQRRCLVSSHRAISYPTMSWFSTRGLRWVAFASKVKLHQFYTLKYVTLHISVSSCRTNLCCCLIPESRSSFGLERRPMRPRKLDQPRLVRQTGDIRHMEKKHQTLFTHGSLFSFQCKTIWIRTPPVAAASPSPPLSRGRSLASSQDGSMPGTPSFGSKTSRSSWNNV